MKDKTRIRKKFVIEGVIALFIAISPILFYGYKYLPVGAKTWTFLGIEFTDNGFDDDVSLPVAEWKGSTKGDNLCDMKLVKKATAQFFE